MTSLHSPAAKSAAPYTSLHSILHALDMPS